MRITQEVVLHVNDLRHCCPYRGILLVHRLGICNKQLHSLTHNNAKCQKTSAHISYRKPAFSVCQVRPFENAGSELPLCEFILK